MVVRKFLEVQAHAQPETWTPVAYCQRAVAVQRENSSVALAAVLVEVALPVVVVAVQRLSSHR